MRYHLNRAMDSGLTQGRSVRGDHAAGVLRGWPNVFSAVPVAKDVFEKRPK